MDTGPPRHSLSLVGTHTHDAALTAFAGSASRCSGGDVVLVTLAFVLDSHRILAAV